MKQWILVCGNPIDGFQFVGPFSDSDSATEYAEKEGHGEWWVCEMDAPSDENE